MTTIAFDLADETATRHLGIQLAGLARAGDVLALWGTLGTGKTTLARAFIRTLTGPDEEVPSPTFTLVQTYDTPIGMIWHFDLFRLERPEEAFELGLEEALADGIALIEWPERLGRLLPRTRLDVTLSVEGEARRGELADCGGWGERIQMLD